MEDLLFLELTVNYVALQDIIYGTASSPSSCDNYLGCKLITKKKKLLFVHRINCELCHAIIDMNATTRSFLYRTRTLAHTRISATEEIQESIWAAESDMANSYMGLKFSTRYCDCVAECKYCRRAEEEHSEFVSACLEEIKMLKKQLVMAEKLDESWIPDEWEPTLRHGWVDVW